MKTDLIKSILLVVTISILAMTDVYAQQDKKLENAEAKFCASITNFVVALDKLEMINFDIDATMEDFKKEYKEAEKAYNKFEKAAAKLEKVEIKESQKAYNKLVDAVNSIEGDTKTSDASGQINDHINTTAEEIADILSIVCK
jgi:predicted lipid-binding transport protein (Tim44 family)